MVTLYNCCQQKDFFYISKLHFIFHNIFTPKKSCKMLPLEICQTVLNSRNAYLSTFKNFLNEWYEKGIVKKSNELNIVRYTSSIAIKTQEKIYCLTWIIYWSFFNYLLQNKISYFACLWIFNRFSIMFRELKPGKSHFLWYSWSIF